ncbi:MULTISPECIES: Zn-dependent hydrolase [Paracoccus]|uniref:Zn-dependent hydrolase n=1 Tax=Paracoccus TaxID=265 RepID=UPI0008E99BE6|nr:Zn-dependent hydrolase [Paracoccus pantotrophus]MDF3856044.1 Zn-dependent hydrolase [Paracoccus pantotrophus]RNI15430.1 Zn-dependent hydrolase [Paracoccus pantotrophus]SFO97063.1 allantoate deiminase [Paracoccus pantotrophus]
MIDKERLFENLMRLGEIGRTESGGVSRLALTDLDQEGLELISGWMKDAGLDVRMDEAGNLIGRKEGRIAEAPAVLTGSHSDTVREGGKFDGALGILGAIEALRCMNEAGVVTDHPIEVYAYRDEEGCRFASSYSGSRIVTGKFEPARLTKADADGITVAEALTKLGIDWTRVGRAARLQGSAKAYVELHIEQGCVLERAGVSVGVVSGICASARGRITLTGEAQHAGTTPMRMRRDPMAAAAVIIQMIEQEASETGTTVATVGTLRTLPGGVNIIPGQVEFTLDCRDLSEAVRDRVLDRITRQVHEICRQRDIECRIEVYSRGLAKLCSQEVQDAIRRACDKVGVGALSLPSGAGHDSGSFHDFCPMGMIFVRSVGGISHSPAEWSTPEDCAAGADVLYHTLLELASARGSGTAAEMLAGTIEITQN